MKKFILLACMICAYQLQAQIQSGRVVYEVTRHLQMRLRGMDEVEQVIPKTITEKIEVLFANNMSLRREVEETLPDEFPGGGGGPVNMRIGGSDDVEWFNFTEKRKVQQREFAAKQYLIIDSVKQLIWKLTGETKNILGYACQRATTTRIGKRFEMSMDNGKVTRKEIGDTAQIVAWFTTAIPVPAGPDFQGQLPGLILEIETGNTGSYKAIEVSAKVDEKVIKEPKKGKKLTTDEFNKERDKTMAEMEKNGRGGRVRGFGG